MICIVDGCDKIAKSKGLCSMHYHRQYRHGRLDRPKTKREQLIENGQSYCPKCKKEKNISEFNKDKHTAFGVAIYCRECNKTKATIRYKGFKSEHRNTQLKSDYNITLDEYNEILIKQNNGCAICGKTINGKRNMCVDHDHETGRVRGLLCSHCNWGLGHFKDNIDLLENAIKYLKKE
jgi:hypothetical protein